MSSRIDRRTAVGSGTVAKIAERNNQAVPIRIATAGPFSRLRAGFASAAKGDLIMAMNRFGFGSLILISSALFQAPVALSDWGWPIVAWLMCGIGLVAMLVVTPAWTTLRRLLALALDIGGATIVLLAGGQSTAFIYLVYHWVVIGNGYRFGGRYAIAGSVASTIGFMIVMNNDPFWREYSSLSYGLLSGLVVLPAYSFVLIHELQKARQEAEQANKSKSLFLAGVSHELRTPLNAIVGTVDLLRTTRLDPAQRTMIDTIATAADGELALVQDVLSFASMEAGQSGLTMADFDLVALVSQVRALIEPSTRLKGLVFNTYIAARTPLELHGDERRIREVLLNICSNAVKFTSKGSVTLAVDGQEHESGWLQLRFEVMDTGIGIDPGAQDRIFVMFAQADETILDRFGGTGLGLALCKRQVELMGGVIGVDSTPGIGSTFWIDLDLQSSAAAQQDLPVPSLDAVQGADDTVVPELAVASSSLSAFPGGETIEIAAGCGVGLPPQDVRERFSTSLPAGATPADMRRAIRIAAANGGTPATGGATVLPPGTERLAGMTILVADDNAINRTILHRMLTRSGLHVKLALDGEQALECLTEGGIDAALLDVNMPVMNGIETAKMYAFSTLGGPQVPLLALTADATAKTQELCLEAGMKAYLTKPIRAAELLTALASAISPAAFEPTPVPRTVEVRLPCLDLSMLAHLEELGGSDFVQMLVSEFERDGAVIVTQVRHACSTSNLARFRDGAHALASISGNMGAAEIRTLCLSWQGMSEPDFMRLRHSLPDQLGVAWVGTASAFASWEERSRPPELLSAVT